MNAQLLELMDQLDSAYLSNGVSITGIPTLEHLPNGSLTVLAGRPVSGKTKVLMEIVKKLAIDDGVSVALMHFRHKPVELLPRIMSDGDPLYEAKIRQARLDDTDWQRLISDIDELSGSSLHILDGTGMQSWGEAVKQINATAPEIVLLDDWSSVGESENNHLMFRKTGPRQLKQLAQELKVPVIVTAWTTLLPEDRDDKRPSIKDLDHYSGIFQVADQITSLYRPSVYEEDYDGENHIELRRIWGGHIGCEESGEIIIDR